MVTGVGITDTIKSLSDLQVRCNLRQADSDRFFSEWIEDLPELDEREEAGIERLKQRYDYHRFDGLLLEGTINLVVVSPLLELAGFLDPPFRIRSPYGIALELDDPEETIRGFIDVLVVQELSQGDTPQYEASRTFSLFPRRHELGEVLRILKRLGQAVVE